MFGSLSVPLLTALFAAAAIGVWVADTHLSSSTDIFASRWGLGEALGGLILLALITNLPEIAINLPWTEKGCTSDGHNKRASQVSIQKGETSWGNKVSTTRSVTVFVLASIVPLVCGVVLDFAAGP